MKTSILTIVGLAASFVFAGPISPAGSLETREDCQVTQFPNGAMCCMACGCNSPAQMSCRVCLQRCICGDNFNSCPLS